MTITLTPRETARLIVERANELQELVNKKCEPRYRDSWRDALRTLEDRVWEAVNHLDDITNLCGVGESGKSEGAPIPPEGEVPVTQVKDEEAIAIDQEAACHSIYALTTELSHLASTHEEGRSLPEDANKAVGILGELIENVKTLYRITADDSSQQTEGR